MFEVFARLAAGRPSVTLVANGGAITLDEVACSVEARRPAVLVSGSGRASDAIVALLEGTTPRDGEGKRLRDRAVALDIGRQPGLFEVFALEKGPRALATRLHERLAR